MTTIREWQVRRRLGHATLIVETDPQRIVTRIRDPRRDRRRIAISNLRPCPTAAKTLLQRLVWEVAPFDLKETTIVRETLEDETFHRMKDVWRHREAPEDSRTHAEIAQTLATEGVYRHKAYEITRKDEIVPLIRDCYLDLLTSMARDGYRDGVEAEHATGGMGGAIVDRDGRLCHQAAATHRLAAARIVGLDHGFPLRVVGAHRDWLLAHGIDRPDRLDRIPDALDGVDGVIASTEPRRKVFAQAGRSG